MGKRRAWEILTDPQLRRELCVRLLMTARHCTYEEAAAEYDRVQAARAAECPHGRPRGARARTTRPGR
jgi:hypothetical protein